MCPDKALLAQHAHPDSVELEAFFRRFNKDKLNGKISMMEFMEELAAKLPN